MERMKTLRELVVWLEAHKGTGRWQEVSDASGVAYDLIAKIARGVKEHPSVITVERICNGIDAVERKARSANGRKPAKQPA